MGKRSALAIRTIGIICGLYYIIDFINNVFFGNGPAWLLWYSSLGLCLTAIALLSLNETLIYIAFIAIFPIEGLWTIDFFFHLLTHNAFLGFSNYLFTGAINRFNYFMAMYHILMPVSLLLGIMWVKKILKYAWIGAIAYVVLIVILTTALVPASMGINCLSPAVQCTTPLSFLYDLQPLLRFSIAISFLCIFVFIPLNYFIVWLKQKDI